jgi:hypothetical protein
MKIYHPKTIKEAIKDLQTFLECDLYTKFRPEVKIGKERMCREDFFKSEKEFEEYLTAHFDILKKEINKLKVSK